MLCDQTNYQCASLDLSRETNSRGQCKRTREFSQPQSLFTDTLMKRSFSSSQRSSSHQTKTCRWKSSPTKAPGSPTNTVC